MRSFGGLLIAPPSSRGCKCHHLVPETTCIIRPDARPGPRRRLAGDSQARSSHRRLDLMGIFAPPSTTVLWRPRCHFWWRVPSRWVGRGHEACLNFDTMGDVEMA